MSLASNLLAELPENPKLSALSGRVRAITQAAFRRGRVQWLLGTEVAELDAASLPALTQEEAQTHWGNVLQVLDRGPSEAQQWSLLGALWALASGTELEADVAEGIWLTTHTPLGPLGFADRAWPPPARSALWDRVVASCLDPTTTASERVTLSAALSLANSEQASEAAARLFDASQEPAVRELLCSNVAAREPLTGDLSVRRSRVRTVVLAVTGLLFVASTWRVVLRIVLGMRRRVTVALQPGGLALTEATVLLGRPLRTKERFVPNDQIALIERETRHAGFSLYAGLFMLALGTYTGMGLLADALRAPGGSPTLLGTGLLAMALGLLFDFLLFRFAPLKEGRARIAIEPARGPGWVVAGADPKRVDAWIRRFTRLRGSV
jgi:hypothetical protein